MRVCGVIAEFNPLHNAHACVLSKASEIAPDGVVVILSGNFVQRGHPAVMDKWRRTEAALRCGADLVIELPAVFALAPAQRFDSEALLALDALQADRIAGKSVLLLRGNGGRELLADTLRARGACVECVTCYRRSAPADGSALVSLLCNSGLDAAIVTSSESLRNLLALLDTESCGRLFDLPVFVPHARIAEEAARLGLRRVVLTRPADAGLVAGLCNYHWPDHE